jgi:hypothetical protein
MVTDPTPGAEFWRLPQPVTGTPQFMVGSESLEPVPEA